MEIKVRILFSNMKSIFIYVANSFFVQFFFITFNQVDCKVGPVEIVLQPEVEAAQTVFGVTQEKRPLAPSVQIRPDGAKG
jgi:hypothetical protein